MKVPEMLADSGTASPNVKKLKQARLPFQVIGSDSPKIESPAPKKRKLSVQNDDIPVKVGKPSEHKENELSTKSDVEPVVISEDEVEVTPEESAIEASDESSLPNPLVIIVGAALQRKLRKRTSTAETLPKKKIKVSQKSPANKSISKKSVKKTKPSKKSETPVETTDFHDIVNVNDDIVTVEDSNEPSDVTISGTTVVSSASDVPSTETDSKSVSPETKAKQTENLEAEILQPDEPIECSSSPVKNITPIEEFTTPRTSKRLIETKSEKVKENGHLDTKQTENVEASNAEMSEPDEPVECGSSPMRDISLSKDEFTTPRSSKRLIESKIAKEEENAHLNTTVESSPNTSLDHKKLTPKQVQKKLESAKKQQEREREKQERDKKKQEEKDEKNRQRLEKEEQRKKEREEKEELKKKEREEKEEQKKKEREEKEEQKKKEREDKERQKEEEKKLREQQEEEKRNEKKREKEAKEEERRKKEVEKEEEKRKKEIEKEEAENKKKKASAAFVNFFVAKESKNTSDSPASDIIIKNEYLSNFTIKSDMRLAPIVRNPLDEERKTSLDSHLTEQKIEIEDLYVMKLRLKVCVGKRSDKTWPLSDLKNDVFIVEDNFPPIEESKEGNLVILEANPTGEILKPKLLGFSENRRPPYWGTWRRKSKFINGRKPFALDKNQLDYSCDSDDEWEEEEPGESVGGSVAGGTDDEEENENEYDVDNDFMVPHGYLSEEEALGEEDQNDFSPETQKAKLKVLEYEFQNEMKKTTEKLHPRLIGIYWQNADSGRPPLCAEAVWNYLNIRKMLTAESQICIATAVDSHDAEADDTLKNNEKSAIKKQKIAESMIPELIRLVYGNTNNRGFLANEFQQHIRNKNNENQIEGEGRKSPLPSDISKISIARKIKEISKWMSCPDEGPMASKTCWYVSSEVREKYNMSDLELPNTWSYTLTPKRKSDFAVKQKLLKETSDVTDESINLKKECAFNIKKFTKQMTDEERKKQFVVSSPANASSGVQSKNQNITGLDPGTSAGQTTTQTSAITKPVEKKRVSLLFSGPRGKSLPQSSDSVEKVTDKVNTNGPVVSALSESKPAPIKPQEKKRVQILASAPIGQDIPKSFKTNLLTQFIKTVSKDDLKNKANPLGNESRMETDEECVVLSD